MGLPTNIAVISLAVASIATFFFATKQLLSPGANHRRLMMDPKTVMYKEPNVNSLLDQARSYSNSMKMNPSNQDMTPSLTGSSGTSGGGGWHTTITSQVQQQMPVQPTFMMNGISGGQMEQQYIPQNQVPASVTLPAQSNYEAQANQVQVPSQSETSSIPPPQNSYIPSTSASFFHKRPALETAIPLKTQETSPQVAAPDTIQFTSSEDSIPTTGSQDLYSADTAGFNQSPGRKESSFFPPQVDPPTTEKPQRIGTETMSKLQKPPEASIFAPTAETTPQFEPKMTGVPEHNAYSPEQQGSNDVQVQFQHDAITGYEPKVKGPLVLTAAAAEPLFATYDKASNTQPTTIVELEPSTPQQQLPQTASSSSSLFEQQQEPAAKEPMVSTTTTKSNTNFQYAFDNSSYLKPSSKTLADVPQESVNQVNAIPESSSMEASTNVEQQATMLRSQSMAEQQNSFRASEGTPASSVGAPPNSQRKLEFVHITKTGGTAIETAAASQTGNLLMWGACHYREIKYQKCTNPDWEMPRSKYAGDRLPTGYRYQGEPWHCPHHWFTNDLTAGSDTFVVVRDPYKRIVSEYYCSSYGYKGPDPDFPETFNRWIGGNVTEVIESTTLKGHMLPQYHYVFDAHTGEKVVTHVLKYENLQWEFDHLMERYGLPIRLPAKTEKGSFHTYTHNSATKNNRHMTVEDISPENIAKINQAYARDFEYFGYPMIDPATHPLSRGTR